MRAGCLWQFLAMVWGGVTLLGLLATLVVPNVLRRLDQAEETLAQAEAVDVSQEEAAMVEPQEPNRLIQSPDPARHPIVATPAPEVGTPAYRAAIVDLLRHGLKFTGSSANIALSQGRPTIFDGSYDLHSCTIANWALLTDARMAQDPERVADILARATPHAIDLELGTLIDRERRLTFTRPYDEAWLAMYLAELERHVADDRKSELRQQRLRLEEHLRAWMEGQVFPEHLFKDEGPAICGFYRSWLWAWVLLTWSDPVSDDLRADLVRWRSERIEPSRVLIAEGVTSHALDFLWVPAVFALIDRLDREATESPPVYDPGTLPDWPVSVKISTVHVLGIEICRTWPLAIDAGRGDESARATHRARIDTLLERDDLWRGDFDAVAHWIPQYLWIGLWLEAGRP